jgi:hypothetical protein
MITNRLFTAISVLTMTAALGACGGGGGGGDDSAAGEVTSVGVISGFGSVIVNDVRYESTNSRIVSADSGASILENPTDAQLRQYLGLGQVVAVRGFSSSDGNGVANIISIDNELVGPIDSIEDGYIVVNGQIVTIKPDTIIDDSIIEAARGGEIDNDLRFGDLSETLDDLFSVDMVVEINGFPTDTGIDATRIEDVDNRDRSGVVPPTGEVEVKGFVENLIPGFEFKINGLTVFYGPDDLDDDFGAGGLSTGQFVEVKGVRISSSQMDANDIELEDDFFDDDFGSGRFEIEGVIKEIRPDTQGTGGVIVIRSQEFRVNDVRLFMVGQRVEIEGTLRNDGSLLTGSVEDESEDTIRTEDIVVSRTGDSFTTRLGLIVTATGGTRLEIEGAGQRIEARGFPLNGGVTWTRIEIEADDDQDCRLRGPVASITGTAEDFSFAIQGVTINVSGVSSNNFEGSNGLSIGRQAFFEALDIGDVVQATANGGGCVTGTLTAREVEFENLLMDGGSDGANDNEIVGTVSNVTANSFDINGRSVTVNDDTLIDDSMIERVRGGEIANDQRFGDITETLQQLLGATPNVEVQLSGDVAISIEDL